MHNGEIVSIYKFHLGDYSSSGPLGCDIMYQHF